MPDRGFHGHEAGLSFGQRSRLVDDQCRYAFQDLERLGVAKQDAELGAAPGPDHDRHRRREPERARARDDQHGDGVDQRMREARLGARHAPDGERRDRDRHDGGDEPAGHDIGKPLNRRPRALRFADQPDDASQQRVVADALGTHDERTGSVDGPAGHFRPGTFSIGIGSPVTIDSSTVVEPSSTVPSTGTCSPGRTRRRSPTPTCASSTSVSTPSASRCAMCGREIQQRPDRRARPAARAELQHLSEEHEHDDDGGRLEVDADVAVLTK